MSAARGFTDVDGPRAIGKRASWKVAAEGRAFGVSTTVITPPVLASSDVCVVGMHDGTLRALDVATGAEKWRHEYASPPAPGNFTPRATVDGARNAVIATHQHTVTSFDVATGAQRWRVRLSPATNHTRIQRDALVHDDLVVVILGNELHAFSAADGARRAQLAIATDGYVCSVAVVGDAFVASTFLFRENPYGGEVVAVDARAPHAERWRNTGGGAGRSALVVDGDGVVRVGGHESGVQALDATGAQVWRADVASLCTPALDGDSVFLVGHGDTRVPTPVVALDAATGRERWRFGDATEHAVLNEVACTRDAVVATLGQALVILDKATGVERCRWRAPHDVQGRPAFTRDRIVVATRRALVCLPFS